MAFIGKIEKKEGKTATILVKKVAPCGDNCKKCSAGCYLYSTYIQTDVGDDVHAGDYVEISAECEAAFNKSLYQYTVPVILMIGSVILVQLMPRIQNKSMVSALAVIFSLIISQFVLNFYDKKKMKNNARLFKVGKKYNGK